ncbi:MAG: Holliday junction resolvase-like protein [Candidatus Woesearchaeota archaeon]
MAEILFVLMLLVGALLIWVGYILGRRVEDYLWKKEKLKPVVQERINASRAVLGGQFSEQLAPYLPEFQYSPTECRFIGKPVDFIVFRGMDSGEIEEVIFLEIKSGKTASLNHRELSLKRAVQDKKVRWEIYRVPEGILKK